MTDTCTFVKLPTTESSSFKYAAFQWWIHVPFEASVGAFGSRLSHEIGTLTKLKPHEAISLKEVEGMP
jgi:hypothetical protein